MSCCRAGPNGGCCGQSWCAEAADDRTAHERQDREERAQALREQQQDREPPIGDPCPECKGTGGGGLLPGGPADIPIRAEDCPRCQGSGMR